MSKKTADTYISKRMVHQKKIAFVKVTLCNVNKMLTSYSQTHVCPIKIQERLLFRLLAIKMLTDFNGFAGQNSYKRLRASKP